MKINLETESELLNNILADEDFLVLDRIKESFSSVTFSLFKIGISLIFIVGMLLFLFNIPIDETPTVVCIIITIIYSCYGIYTHLFFPIIIYRIRLRIEYDIYEVCVCKSPIIKGAKEHTAKFIGKIN